MLVFHMQCPKQQQKIVMVQSIDTAGGYIMYIFAEEYESKPQLAVGSCAICSRTLW